MMNTFDIKTGELFSVGETDLRELLDSPCKISFGMILFCLDGTGEVSVELTKCPMRKHTVCLILPSTILTLNQADADFRVSYVSFVRTLFDEAVFRFEPSFFRFIKDNPSFTHTPDGAEIVLSIFRLIGLNYQDRKNMFRDSIAKNQLQSFFMSIYSKTKEEFTFRQRNSPNSRAEEIFHKLIACIQANYLTRKDVAFYAGKLCISPRYLSSVTRQITGESAKTIIDRHIILEIKVMLRSTELSIQEISNRLDFPSQSYLGRFFKKHTEESPVEYRNRRNR